MEERILSGDTVLSREPGVLCERVGGEFVLLDPGNDRYVRLNATGGLLFDALETPQTAEELAGRLRERGAPEDRALDDALAFASDLVRRGVVRAG
jgi:hypothetical protein